MSYTEQQLEILRESIDVIVREFRIKEGVSIEQYKLKLNPADVHTIFFISKSNKCISADISSFLKVSPTTMSSIIDRLVKRQLVSRERTEENRRVIELNLTEYGREIIQIISSEQLRHSEKILSHLSDSEQLQFIELIGKIARNLQ